jgi:anti-sigma regulatory factor (Ser/Thr protein kinase)
VLKPHIVLISKLEEDNRVFSIIACKLGFSFSQVNDRDSLRAILQLFPDSVVVWSTEHPDPAAGKIPKSLLTIEETLRKLISPSRVFALSDRPLSRNQVLFETVPFFQHYIVRRFIDPASDVLARLLISALVPHPVGLKRYFAEGTSSQNVTIKKSSQRAVAVDAVDAFFQKKGIKARLAARVAQATDELLMNAIFNAPHNGLGNPTRRLQSRSDDFSLGKNELVQMEILYNDQYVGVCVTDQFGALDREVVLRLMAKNYRKNEYTPKDNQPGAGLGLYGIIEMGFSLIFSVKSGSRTDSMIIFPTGGGNMKGFREGFQFVAFFGGVAYKKGTPG